jgi:hypothetical protein
VLDQDVFQTARALHARFHAVPWSLVTDVLALGVSEHVTTLSNASLLNCVSGGILSLHMHPCSSLIVDCWQQRTLSCRRMPFGFALRLYQIGYRVPTDTRSVGVSTTGYDEAHWFVQTTFPPFCLHSPNRVTHANPAISRVPASAEPVGRTSQHIYLP